jgi:hypothetical protein
MLVPERRRGLGFNSASCPGVNISGEIQGLITIRKKKHTTVSFGRFNEKAAKRAQKTNS